MDFGFLSQCFRDGRVHVEGLMWAGVIVFLQPLIAGDLCLFGGREPAGIENLPAQRAIEPLVV